MIIGDYGEVLPGQDVKHDMNEIITFLHISGVASVHYTNICKQQKKNITNSKFVVKTKPTANLRHKKEK